MKPKINLKKIACSTIVIFREKLRKTVFFQEFFATFMFSKKEPLWVNSITLNQEVVLGTPIRYNG